MAGKRLWSLETSDELSDKKEEIGAPLICITKFILTSFFIYNIWTRLLYGVVDINGFFTNNKSEFCSFVDKWNILDFHIFHLRELICFLLIIIIHYSTYINNKIPSYIKSNKYLLRIIEIVLTLYKTIFSYIIL